MKEQYSMVVKAIVLGRKKGIFVKMMLQMRLNAILMKKHRKLRQELRMQRQQLQQYQESLLGLDF